MTSARGDASEADVLEQRSTESGIEDDATDDLVEAWTVPDDVDEADALDQQRDAEPDDPEP